MLSAAREITVYYMPLVQLIKLFLATVFDTLASASNKSAICVILSLSVHVKKNEKNCYLIYFRVVQIYTSHYTIYTLNFILSDFIMLCD